MTETLKFVLVAFVTACFLLIPIKGAVRFYFHEKRAYLRAMSDSVSEPDNEF